MPPLLVQGGGGGGGGGGGERQFMRGTQALTQGSDSWHKAKQQLYENINPHPYSLIPLALLSVLKLRASGKGEHLDTWAAFY